jgi:uncharacterized repeat protein (TIGR03803 family)
LEWSLGNHFAIGDLTVNYRLALLVALVLAVFAAPTAKAQTFNTLYTFRGESDGGNPYADVIEDSSGNLYGTSYFGGAGCFGEGCGVVFSVNSANGEAALYTFTGSSDGGDPTSSVVQDTQGNLYGTAYYGGTKHQGVVFMVDTAGSETVLHTFVGGKNDGCFPEGGLFRGASGTLYGTTLECGAHGLGTIFKVSKDGVFTLLHSFAGGSKDGANPELGNLIADTKGNLYGVTGNGGPSQNGVVFRLSPAGKLVVLHAFKGGTTDGCYSFGTLATDKAGNLYGTTSGCGAFGYGTVWELSATAKETVLYNFAGGATDGCYPTAGVVLDSTGNLYGDTVQCGASGYGTVFELSNGGTLTLLHSFLFSDGAYPVGGLLWDSSGNLYGTTSDGGTGVLYEGTVWSLAP